MEEPLLRQHCPHILRVSVEGETHKGMLVAGPELDWPEEGQRGEKEAAFPTVLVPTRPTVRDTGGHRQDRMALASPRQGPLEHGSHRTRVLARKLCVAPDTEKVKLLPQKSGLAPATPTHTPVPRTGPGVGQISVQTPLNAQGSGRSQAEEWGR